MQLVEIMLVLYIQTNASSIRFAHDENENIPSRLGRTCISGLLTCLGNISCTSLYNNINWSLTRLSYGILFIDNSLTSLSYGFASTSLVTFNNSSLTSWSYGAVSTSLVTFTTSYNASQVPLGTNTNTSWASFINTSITAHSDSYNT